MPSPVEAMRAIVAVRWPLLESYALARQEGLAEPVGLVIERRFAYAEELSAQILFGTATSGERSTSCMERAVLVRHLSGVAPELATLLRNSRDEPGRWLAVLLAERGWLLAGTWQELMIAEDRAVPLAGLSGRR